MAIFRDIFEFEIRKSDDCERLVKTLHFGMNSIFPLAYTVEDAAMNADP